MIEFDVDQQNVYKEEQLSEKTLEKILKLINDSVKDRKGVIAVSFVDDMEIQRLNRMYRYKDAVTDVLSFEYPESDCSIDYIGDVVIAIEQARRQSTEGDLELEFVDLLVHGILHVLGYDHEVPEDAQEMFPLQDSIVQSVL